MSNEVLVLQMKTLVKPEKLGTIYDSIMAQKENGVILLPLLVDLVHVTDKDCEIKVLDMEGNEIESSEAVYGRSFYI